MQGYITIKGRMAKSKAEIKRSNIHDLIFTDTSAFANAGSFTVADLLDGDHVFVGPDPYNNRKFYGNINNKGRIK